MIRVDAACYNGLSSDQNWLGVYSLQHNNALDITKIYSAKKLEDAELKNFRSYFAMHKKF